VFSARRVPSRGAYLFRIAKKHVIYYIDHSIAQEAREMLLGALNFTKEQEAYIL
jgi:hypothetical protein